jgi:hypothetical protein
MLNIISETLELEPEFLKLNIRMLEVGNASELLSNFM